MQGQICNRSPGACLNTRKRHHRPVPGEVASADTDRNATLFHSGVSYGMYYPYRRAQ